MNDSIEVSKKVWDAAKKHGYKHLADRVGVAEPVIVAMSALGQRAEELARAEQENDASAVRSAKGAVAAALALVRDSDVAHVAATVHHVEDPAPIPGMIHASGHGVAPLMEGDIREKVRAGVARLGVDLVTNRLGVSRQVVVDLQHGVAVRPSDLQHVLITLNHLDEPAPEASAPSPVSKEPAKHGSHDAVYGFHDHEASPVPPVGRRGR